MRTKAPTKVAAAVAKDKVAAEEKKAAEPGKPKRVVLKKVRSEQLDDDKSDGSAYTRHSIGDEDDEVIAEKKADGRGFKKLSKAKAKAAAEEEDHRSSEIWAQNDFCRKMRERAELFALPLSLRAEEDGLISEVAKFTAKIVYSITPAGKLSGEYLLDLERPKKNELICGICGKVVADTKCFFCDECEHFVCREDSCAKVVDDSFVCGKCYAEKRRVKFEPPAMEWITCGLKGVDAALFGSCEACK